jgi:hypothetical protein
MDEEAMSHASSMLRGEFDEAKGPLAQPLPMLRQNQIVPLALGNLNQHPQEVHGGGMRSPTEQGLSPAANAADASDKAKSLKCFDGRVQRAGKSDPKTSSVGSFFPGPPRLRAPQAGAVGHGISGAATGSISIGSTLSPLGFTDVLDSQLGHGSHTPSHASSLRAGNGRTASQKIQASGGVVTLKESRGFKAMEEQADCQTSAAFFLKQRTKAHAELANMSQLDQFLSRFIAHPDSSIAIAWHILMMFCAIISAATVPFRLGFEVDGGSVAVSSQSQVLDVVMEVCFMLDIAFNCFLCYDDADTQHLITHPKQIRMNYLQGWALLDVISSIPVELVAVATDTIAVSGNLAVIKPLRLCKIFRLFRLLHLRALDHMEAKGVLNLSLLRLLKLVFSFLFVLHFMSCAYWGIAVHQCLDGDGDGVTDSPWCPSQDEMQSDTDVSVKYAAAFMWSTLALIGAGEPLAPSQRRLTATRRHVRADGDGERVHDLHDADRRVGLRHDHR